MVFNVTNLDKVLLIKTLYAYAAPKGLGKIEYSIRKGAGENVIGLTDEECERILQADTPESTELLVDYYNGKPIKLDFDRQLNGDIFVHTSGYDARNGRYRFLEALLNVFDLDEIIITKKGYANYLNDELDKHTIRPKEETKLLVNILKHTVKHKDHGIYWKIDTQVVDYQPPFMREI